MPEHYVANRHQLTGLKETGQNETGRKTLKRHIDNNYLYVGFLSRYLNNISCISQ